MKVNEMVKNIGWSLVGISMLTMAIQCAAQDPTIEYLRREAQELHKSGNTFGAMEAYKQLIKLYPDQVQPYIDLALLLKDAEQFYDALYFLQQAKKLTCNDFTINFYLAYIHTVLGDIDEAVHYNDLMLKRDPHNQTVLYNKAYVLKMGGRIEQALPIYQELVRVQPENHNARFGLGMAYLVKGDFEHGFQEHAHYLRRTNRNAERLRHYLRTNTLEGKRILLKPEGGLGDTLQFIRYAQELRARGAYVIASVQTPLFELLKDQNLCDKLIKMNDAVSGFHDYTTHMSMPAILYETEKSIPAPIPYLKANPERVAYWSTYLAKDPNIKIGICWEASVHNDSSRPPAARRGMPLKALYPLANIPGVSLYSLQQYDGVEQLADVPKNITINTFDENFDKTYGAFVDTAAVMHHLDLIISVDTAIPHLAGALGKPVWLMLPFATDWRWIAGRKDSPWYPSMRIFQQPKAFDWHSVTQEVVREVKDMVTKHKNYK